MFKWFKRFFKKPINKIVLRRSGPLTDVDIALEIKKFREDKDRERKEYLRLEIKANEGNCCFKRAEERNHYINEAKIENGFIDIHCAFCDTAIMKYYKSTQSWIEELLREEGFE